MATIGQLSKIPLRGCEIEWAIEDFFSLSEEVGKTYGSPSFFVADSHWRFTIFTTSPISPMFVDLYLERLSAGPPISLEFALRLKTEGEGKECVQEFTQVFDTEVMKYIAYECLSKTTLSERKSVLVPLDVLTIVATLKYHDHEFNEDASNTATAQCPHCEEALDAAILLSHEEVCPERVVECPECSKVVILKDWQEHDCQKPEENGEDGAPKTSLFLQEYKVFRDFKELFLKKEDCDVLIKVEGQAFPAHKAILKARSPVFASTFRSEMKEKSTGIVDIEDGEASSFSDFLCFLYCGDVGIISKENMFKLFTAADKYDVQDLRAKCVEFMEKNLSVDTFCDTITLALQHSDADLTNLTIDFFIKNAPKIIVTVKWQTFLAENPTQSNELLIKLLVPNNSS